METLEELELIACSDILEDSSSEPDGSAQQPVGADGVECTVRTDNDAKFSCFGLERGSRSESVTDVSLDSMVELESPVRVQSSQVANLDELVEMEFQSRSGGCEPVGMAAFLDQAGIKKYFGLKSITPPPPPPAK
jgi:hypothetical protein